MSGSRKKITRPDVARKNNDSIDEANDYQYFKELWNQSAGQTTNNMQDGTKLGPGVSELPPKKKRRKVTRDDKHHDEKPAGPIENMDFVKDNKEEGGRNETKAASNNNASRHPNSKVGDDNIKSNPEYHHEVHPPDGHDNDNILLYQHFSIPEIDNLVGWATSHCGNNNDPNPMAKAAPANHDILSGQQEQRLGLSHIPTAPPPPSHVAFLHQRMSEKLMTNTANGEAAASDGDEGSININTISKQNDNVDASVYVTVGMAVEEVLTMALMPLAEAHVEHCRRLEIQKNCHATNTTEWPNQQSGVEQCSWNRSNGADTFHAWTRPPAEAIVQLARDGSANRNCALASLLDRHSQGDKNFNET
mmetsp:Transcript_12308/g.26739  ORF Transcript_12308/g.26739 Transcript_12308/m.26739 type:complete len:362 (+) Transcript_12308:259-1344(+)|eukprot:CAMPEP_0172316520 /NCGR_PEP_ID=MMETSP1058-20130122/28512_1 /TAXON_ID=83371 /ORGANISM="Detonula confervacea, Strain CCMP 353" /LENGTH=361 /DNA_ID=CAMNT_0013030843 /DNA_START=194 /DNA_END=1279 /DNA_ORIENTATION=+